MSSGLLPDRKYSQINTVVAYTLAPWDHALAVLRIVAPLLKAGITPIHGNPGGQIYPGKVSEADLVLIQRDFPIHLQAYQEILALARAQSKPVVLDLDDWLLELPENHPDRLSHHYAGALFPVLRAIIEADAVTVSTPRLAERLYPLNDNIRVLPNYIDEALWDFQTLPQPVDPQQPVKLVFMGGDSHTPDFEPLLPVLIEILNTYDKRIKLISVGMQLAPVLCEFPNVQVIPFKFAYPSYAKFVQEQHFDLAIAPLADNLFNQCKSAMKYLEYSTLGVPGVYSRITPYSNMITPGVNGFLASHPDEWKQCITRLIEDAHLRGQMGLAAQDSVKQQWLLGHHAWEWAEAYQIAVSAVGRERTRATLPVDLFANLTIQHRQWEQALQNRLTAREREVDALNIRLVEKEQYIAALTTQLTALRRSLFGRLSRGVQWVSSQLNSKTER